MPNLQEAVIARLHIPAASTFRPLGPDQVPALFLRTRAITFAKAAIGPLDWWSQQMRGFERPDRLAHADARPNPKRHRAQLHALNQGHRAILKLALPRVDIALQILSGQSWRRPSKWRLIDPVCACGLQGPAYRAHCLRGHHRLGLAQSPGPARTNRHEPSLLQPVRSVLDPPCQPAHLQDRKYVQDDLLTQVAQHGASQNADSATGL